MDILFTDIDMLGSIDGLKLAAAVRHRWPPVKIIVTSGHRTVGAGDMPEGSVFQQLTEQGRPRFNVLAAIDRLIDRGEINVSGGAQRLALRGCSPGMHP